MPPHARQGALLVWQSAQLKSSARAKGQLRYRPCHQGLTESLSEEHHRAEVAQEQTQVSNQEAQSRLLSKTFLSCRSGSGSPDSLHRPLAGSLLNHAAPNYSVCSGAEPTNHIGSCLTAAVKRRRVCAGLCKQITADWTNISTNSDTEPRARA